ncbi:hypothetical protein ACT7CY_19140 [Bacillus pacificus]
MNIKQFKISAIASICGLSILSYFPTNLKADELPSVSIISEDNDTIILEKGMYLENNELPLYAPQLGSSLIFEDDFNPNSNFGIQYAPVGQGGGGTYDGWKRERSYNFKADTSIPQLPGAVAIALGGAGLKIAPVGYFGYGYDLATRLINTLAAHKRSYGTIAVYKHPSKNQWVSLWTVWDAGGRLVYSKFGNVVNKRPTV